MGCGKPWRSPGGPEGPRAPTASPDEELSKESDIGGSGLCVDQGKRVGDVLSAAPANLIPKRSIRARVPTFVTQRSQHASGDRELATVEYASPPVRSCRRR